MHFPSRLFAKKPFLFLCAVLAYWTASAQNLKPGFDKEEYKKLMYVSAQFGDSGYRAKLPPPRGYRKLYESPTVGLENKWELWLTDASVPVISIRGTTQNAVSWLTNFYAAMVPAKGNLQLTDAFKFSYDLASHPQAAVHTGWLVSTAFLARDILPKIDSLQKAGKRELLIIGHSQGGAIAYLLTAYLLNLQKQSGLPPTLRFKTYCSAGPKPGNLPFAHEYEAATQGGWAYNVVNSADWVPETPVSVQKLSDFNEVNPFVNAKEIIKNQSFFRRLALNIGFGKLKNPNDKAAENYRKFLGGYVAKSVKKHLPGFTEPRYAEGVNYVRTGNIITLLADEDYFKTFPQNEDSVFANHLHQPYLYLLNKLSMDGQQSTTGTLPVAGTWELDSLAGTTGFASLYPTRRPAITIDAAAQKVSGNTGCNSFNGGATVGSESIRFAEGLAMTRMACPGNGEALFLSALKSVNRYAAEGDVLRLMVNDVVVMRFRKKAD